MNWWTKWQEKKHFIINHCTCKLFYGRVNKVWHVSTAAADLLVHVVSTGLVALQQSQSGQTGVAAF